MQREVQTAEEIPKESLSDMLKEGKTLDHSNPLCLWGVLNNYLSLFCIKSQVPLEESTEHSCHFKEKALNVLKMFTEPSSQRNIFITL